MLGFDSFLDKEPEELEQFLLEVARQDSAPAEARERALHNVASAALGVGVLSGLAAYGSPTSLVKATGWLVAKWLAAGFGAGLLTITAAQAVGRLATHHPSSQPVALSVVESKTAPQALAPRRPSTISPERDSTDPTQPGQDSAASTPVAPAVATGARSLGNLAASSRGQTTVTTEPSSLTRELSLLEQARAALSQHAAAQALLALDEYQARFPSGSLRVEAAALRIEAVGQAGNRVLARQLAESFLSSFPSSPLTARIRATVDAIGSDAQKP